MVNSGDTVEAVIKISGLGDFFVDSLSAYHLLITFDDSILTFNNATFGDPIDGSWLDLFGSDGY